MGQKGIPRVFEDLKMSFILHLASLQRRSTIRSSLAGLDDEGTGARRRTVILDSSLNNFKKMLDSAGEFMRDEIEKLPLRKYEYVRVEYVRYSI